MDTPHSSFPLPQSDLSLLLSETSPAISAASFTSRIVSTPSVSLPLELAYLVRIHCSQEEIDRCSLFSEIWKTLKRAAELLSLFGDFENAHQSCRVALNRSFVLIKFRESINQDIYDPIFCLLNDFQESGTM